MPGQQRRLAAIMFTDIVGYTAMMGDNEEHAFQILRINRRIQKEQIKRHGGTWLKEMGDGILASFSSTTEAVLCAQHIQILAKKQGIPLRVGIHQGEVIFEGGDVLGDGVNVASRIQEIAEKGCIAVSEPVYNNVKNKTHIHSSFISETRLKNVEKPINIYQITCPDDGIIEQRERPILPSNFGKKIKLIIGVLVLISVILLGLFFRDLFPMQNPYDEPAIAILPFNSLNEDNHYFSNGIMDAILGHLSRKDDLIVKSRLSVEKYRQTNLTAREIGEELEVQYLLTGSVWKQAEDFQITINLIDAIQDKVIWSVSQENDFNDLIEVLRSVTQQIIEKINLSLSPSEKDLINDYPTTEIRTYDYLMQAREFHYDFWLKDDLSALERAVILYNRTLDYDSTIAQAYTGLAMAYWDKHYWETFYNDTFLDSVKWLVNKAIQYNDQLEEAYYIKSRYHQVRGEIRRAFSNIRRAIEINPNYILAIRHLGLLYIRENKDYIEGLKYLTKAAGMEHSRILPSLLREIGDAYGSVGFPEEEHRYYWEALKLDSDSILYFNLLFYREQNPELALPYAKRICEFDSTNILCYESMASYHLKSGNYEEASYYYFKYLESYKSSSEFNLTNRRRIGYVYWNLGMKEVAMNYFDEQIKFCKKNIQKNREYARQFGLAYYDLASIYAFLGEKDKAYYYLDRFSDQNFFPQWMIELIKNDELMLSIRNDSRFQTIISTMEEKYLKEHNRVEEWMNRQKKAT